MKGAVLHQPATPLPFRVEKDGDSFKVIHAEDARVTSLHYARGVYAQREVAQTDSAYIAHAANAYPKLVEALRFGLRAIEGKMARNVGLTAHEIAFRDEAEPLLRELGEAT